MPGDSDRAHESARNFADEYEGREVQEVISGRSGTVCGYDGPNVKIRTRSGIELLSPVRRLAPA
ncbi:hypothetical protein EHYA_07621 [Embleya hyalina]|uniref:Uncharacterized protein n=1 Tax=Embleya hyalina TaxID=516124 RepID=A0A401YZ47_9ACTN|nr:hypothetical protein EHYA_07621 [Embleya hyalina]